MRDYEPYFTEDGSVGLYSYADKDVFHSKFGALTESWEKFILPANIDCEKIKELKVLDVCYGIGYNTKALMSYLLNNSKIKKQNIKKRIFKKFTNIVSICNNKSSIILSTDTDTIDNNNIVPKYYIDCLEINSELVKLSPLFKTLKTPSEIYKIIVPSIFNCFETYYKLEKIFINLYSKFTYKNKKEINELLDLKFKNMHIKSEYKVHKYVNYILIDSLFKYYNKNFIDEIFKKNIRETKNKHFIDKKLLNYIKFNSICGYSNSPLRFLSTFLHNIYYGTLSLRDKKVCFKDAKRLFNINYYINDARKTILSIKQQYDLIFLDAFTYTKAPQLWSVEFLSELYKHLSATGLLMTYSTSAQVRKTLLDNNFYVGKIIDKNNNKIIGTIASKDKSKIEHPLNNFEIGLCNTKAGIPFHDPNLSFTNKEITELREYEFKNSKLISSSQYMKLRKQENENNEKEI